MVRCVGKPSATDATLEALATIVELERERSGTRAPKPF